MEADHQRLEHSDPATLEKQIDSDRASTAPSLHHTDVPPGRAPQAITTHRKFLSEEEALQHARENPDDEEPVYLAYSFNDGDNPRNWPKWKKWYITSFVSMLNVLTCLCAGGYSSGKEQLTSTFGVSSEVGTVGLSMYILGFAVGPLMLAPMSEYFGRNPVYMLSWLLLVIFQIPLALAPNIATVIACRLLQGFFGSAPLTNTGGTVSDLWARDECGPAMAVYGLSSTGGPPLALVISGYVAIKKGWRWLFWVYMAVLGGFWILLVFTVPETRHTIILGKKTKRLRKLLRSEGLAAARTIRDANSDEKAGLGTLFAVTLTRPFRFLFTEPITLAAAIYNGFIYGIVYLFNEAFPLVFGPGGHDFNTGEWGAAFVGLFIGSVVAVMLHPLQERYYLTQVARNDGKGVPEARMHLARFGTFLLPISLFWFAWTSFPSVHWIVPIIASALFGAGIYIIILAVLNYVVDSYQSYAASALAGVILIRNLVGAGFPLFGTQMYDHLGLEWASSLLAFLSLPMCVIPFLFFYKGEYLRLKSPWAREHFAQDEDMPH
ncbi:hypothetical protein INS49_015807 [Diaporthe citri]|uniref:uncharacterized protein n=1 Tax=Diaporthe citri TaxID=83186 RepID=UPI001C817F1F|nr:uncharacterized protein INS49_015807 [Diaporthe citri]KAG6356419.1 hypothetical protein INS49_015807 [Diaporthe citri]